MKAVEPSCGLQDREYWYFEDGEDDGVVYVVLHLEELVVECGEMEEFGKGKKKIGAILKREACNEGRIVVSRVWLEEEVGMRELGRRK